MPTCSPVLNNKIRKTEDVLVDGAVRKVQNCVASRESRRRLTNMLNNELNVNALCSTDQIDAD